MAQRNTIPLVPEDEDGGVFSLAQLRLLNRIAHHLGTADDLESALRLVLEWLEQKCAMNRGVITLMNDLDGELQASISVSSISEHFVDKMRYRPGEGVTGRVFAEMKPVFIPDVEQDANFLDRSGLRQRPGRKPLSFFCVPILYRDAAIGTLSVDMNRELVKNGGQELAFLENIAALLAPFVQRRRLEDRMELFVRARQPGGAFHRMIGNSTAIKEIKKLAVRVADVATTVLLTGETGTGKGVVAQSIHQLSPRKDKPFVEVNCGAIPESLLESELFGHEKGAFTGAIVRRSGVLERAGEGTVFLDEIGELPLPAQTRLLRVLQTREFERVGGSETLTFKARIITATNRDLETAVAEGRFRADLFYRLNVFPIHIPPLRERGKADILLLVEFFVQHFASQMDKKIFRLDTPSIDMLTAYHWPGNVRELENVVERAVLLADADVIHGHHLPPSLQMNVYAPRKEKRAGDFETLVRNFEIEMLTEALKDCRGNQTKAAQQLKITKRMIQYKIQQYAIDYERFK